MLYLDHAATTPLRPEARHAMEPYLTEAFGNPSGIHATSRRAKDAIEDARERAAALLGATRPLEIIFTGGGTESDNLAVTGTALAGGGRGGVVTTAIEHEAVLESARFLERLGSPVDFISVDRDGRVDPTEVAGAVNESTAVVSVMTANNETGAIQPVPEVAAAVRERGFDVPIHTDAAQAFVSADVTVAGLGPDLITLAAHKFGGPKGVGLLWARTGIELEPVLHGGGQEMGRRSGTHNVAGIIGMVAAMEASAGERDEFVRRIGAERDAFEAALMSTLGDVTVSVVGGPRLVQHSHVRIPGVTAETLLVRLDAAGVAAAAGSACQSGALQSSHVLAAMGVNDEEARQSLRFSFGWSTAPGEGEAAARIVADLVGRLR
jgi:cysteine desulfurase